jgi:hypothetical protein
VLPSSCLLSSLWSICIIYTVVKANMGRRKGRGGASFCEDVGGRIGVVCWGMGTPPST